MNMKKIILIITAIFALAVVSCQTLDVTPPNSITNEQIVELLATADETTANMIMAAVGSGLQDYFNFGGTYDGGYSHVYKNSQIDQEYILNLWGNDVVCSALGKGDSHRNFYNLNGTFFDATNSNPWWDMPVDFYIAANKTLDTTNEDAYANNPKVVGPYRAQALVVRAWGYLNLLERFAPAYAQDPTAKGLPIYTEYKVNPVAEISSIDDTYGYIIGWLEEAVRIMEDANVKMTYTTDNTEDIDLGVANYLLMRAYLEHKEYTKAATVGEKIIAKYPNFIAEANYGVKASRAAALAANTDEAPAEDNAFLNITVNPEVIFGFKYGSTYCNSSKTALQFASANAYALKNVFGSGIGGYSGTFPRIDNRLYEQINANDVRKDLFLLNDLPFTYVTNQSEGKTGDNTILAYSNTKFGATKALAESARSERTYCDDICIRSSEVYLMLAEAYNSGGDATKAKNTLNKLLAARTKAGAATTLTCDNYGVSDLTKLIQLQWRIEMWCEKGLEFYNNKRWNIPVDRNGSSVHNSEIKTLSLAGMVFDVPVDEKTANTNWSK